MKLRERRLSSQEFQKVLSSLERRYVVKVFNALKQQISSFTSDMNTYGVEFARRRLQSLQFSGTMTQTIQEMHITAGLLMANRTLRGLRKHGAQKRTMGFDQQWIDDIIAYFRLYLLDSVDTISETTKKHILDILEEGFQKSWSVDEIAAAINDKVYMKNRAVKIVRTESVRAANYGVKKGADTYEFEVVKEWVSIADNRRRHSHMVVDGQQREMEEPFSNGLQYPGDPNGAPAEVIFCRCVIVIEPKRDAEGNLIPKKRISVIQPGQFIRPGQQIVTV